MPLSNAQEDCMTRNSRAYRIRQVETVLLDDMTERGYDLIEIPIIEKADVFLTRAGDKIIDRLFTFDHRGQQMALRPEFTAAAARYYIEKHQGQTVRWQFTGTTFADDDADPSSYQQHSIGAELIGQAGSEAEAEIMHMAAAGAEKVGLRDWKLVTGHFGLQTHLLLRFGLDNRTARLLLTQREALINPAQGIAYALEQLNQVLSFLPESEKARQPDSSNAGTQHMLDVMLDSTQYGTTMGGRTREEIAARVLQKHRRSLERGQIADALKFLSEWVNTSESAESAFKQVAGFIDLDDRTGWRLYDDWRHTIELLLKAGTLSKQVIIQPNLARNWEYYTGIVFGIRAGSGEYVAGGGRYDELVSLLGGKQPAPAVGLAYYVDRLLKEIPEKL
jgi:histidyl-tRNA synthetase